MKEDLKQRLIGALILVALGVIFWPIIFVDPPGPPVRPMSIPPRPDVDTSPVAQPSAESLRASPDREVDGGNGEGTDPAVVTPAAIPDDAPDDAPAPVVAQPPQAAGSSPPDAAADSGVSVPRTRLEAPVSPELDADGVPIAWILQVATVSSASKAEALRSALLAVDEKAYVKRVRRGGKSLYRVYVGPKFERSRLESLKPRVDAEFKVESLIVRYLP